MTELHDDIPSFEKREHADHGPIDWSGLTSVPGARSALEIAVLVGLFAVVFFLIQGILTWTNTPTYVFPKPIDTVKTFAQDFTSTEIHSLKVTAIEFLAGLAIGSTIGLLLAALLTQRPFAEKVIAPYVLIMVTTPMLAFVPFLRLKMGFGLWPLIIAVALASGPMVMINSATGFRRTDLAKIALARSYGASTFQIFAKIRFPLALPMIIVGFMVGSIFGLLTAVGGEMVAASEQGGLGRDLVYYSSLARMSQFGATILIIAILGVLIYVVFYAIGKRWASWEA
ncbi:MAG TPA: ABC transporter permease subunit [Gaiellaceae bacterium]|jgi:NitT/TauT family transport system permease protein